MRVRVSRWAVVSVVVLAVLGMWRMRAGGLSEAELWAAATSWGAIGVAALAHEAGHLLAARLVGVPVRGLRLELLGARMTLGGVISYGREAVIAAAGPTVSLLMAGGLWPAMEGAAGDFGAAVCVASLGLGAFNLLPVESMDGGRVLRCVAARLLGVRAADALLRICTAVVLGGVWLIAVYGMLVAGELVGVFGFAVCLMVRMLAREEG